jgi:RND superfamily putative drug exporter
MFRLLGPIVSRAWPVWLVGWGAIWLGTYATAPRWQDVAKDGEFDFMPADAPSRRGDELLRRAFPGQRTESSIIVLLSRRGGKEALTATDRRWISAELRPGLERTLGTKQGAAVDRTGGTQTKRPSVVQFLALDDADVGPLLVSEDDRATLIVIGLNTDFLVRANIAIVDRVEEVIKELHRKGSVPSGLRIALTGSAVLGRDMMREEAKSARAIRSWTVALVIVLLLAFYRAPVLALIPLVTLYVAVEVAIRLLAMMARAGYVEVFRGLDVYTTVVVYAAGVDYNLFLIARYQEESTAQRSTGSALAQALGQIGGALVASGATVICGIGTLMLADFGKFREAGLGIAFSLFVLLCATLTLSAALLRLAGRWAFWPWHPDEGRMPAEDSADPRAAWFRQSRSPFRRLWETVGAQLLRRPGTIWLVTVVILSPLAVIAVRNYNHVNYGLIQGLPENAPSVQGTRELTKHFPPGYAGPLTLVLRNDRINFAQNDGIDLVGEFTARLKRRAGELKIADIRSVVEPLGITRRARQALSAGGFLAAFTRPLQLGRAIEHYVSDAKGLDHHVTRLDIMLTVDPFTLSGLNHVDVIKTAVDREMPAQLKASAEWYLAGNAASFRDLKAVGDRDRERISLLVTLSVLAVLILLLRRLVLPIYLILTVLFGYLATLGATFAVFRLISGAQFVGLDWTVPIFLFTLLVAIGEDYNIILVTRADEEEQRHGPIEGVTQALAKTGGVISGCGFIMAGTFSALAFGGSLARMYQLGFALTFGVLLDTFVVRPILVPAFMIILHAGGLGGLLKSHRREPVASLR